MNKEFHEKIMTDKAFRAEFMTAPAATFTKYSIDMSKDKKIEVHENTKTKMHYALLPEGTDLEDLNVPEEFKQIQKKAWEDKTYLEMLLTDPKKAVTQIMGSVPASLEISFYAYDPTTAHVILPAIEEESDELSDDDLEMVAGGSSKNGVKKGTNQIIDGGYENTMAGLNTLFNEFEPKPVQKVTDLVDSAICKVFSGW